MLFFKYGILIRNDHPNGVSQWRIAILTPSVAEHECIVVAESLFDFVPSLGCSVKVGFDSFESEIPTVVQKFGEIGWIRDSEIVEETVVIFALVYFSETCLRRSVRRHNTSNHRLYYLIENDLTDFHRIAIPKDVVDFELSRRSPHQKAGERLAYRIGICYDPHTFENGETALWRYYEDFRIVPTFELYSREATLPYLSDSVVYGVLEGIVVASNEEGVLFWSPSMGCSVLSSVTAPTMPPLGSVNLILTKRCLPDDSFDFSCHYELLPSIIAHKWDQLKLITDRQRSSVYIEAYCECVKMYEEQGQVICIDVPHIGKLKRGLEGLWHKLIVGRKYHFRIEFEKTDNSYEPVIVDLKLTAEEMTVKCRIVHTAENKRMYFAVLDSRDEQFERIKHMIDFIVIPFRVMFCSVNMHVEFGQLLVHCFQVTIKRPKERHDTVNALHVHGYDTSMRDQDYRVFQGRTWLRTVVTPTNYTSEGPITLICERLGQQIVDYARMSYVHCDRRSIVVQAQFALTPGSVPMFLVRFVASSFSLLPNLTPPAVSSLPPLKNVFRELFVPQEEPTSSSSRRSIPSESDSFLSFAASSVHSPEIEYQRNDSYSDVQTILDESEYERRFGRAASETGTVVERIREGPSSRAQSVAAASISGEIITESFFASETSSGVSSGMKTPFSSVSRPTATIDQRSLFGYSEPRPGRRGFGPPSYRRYQGYGGGHQRTKPVKYGVRKLHPNHRMTHNELLFDIAYRYLGDRPMFLENQREAISSWFRRPGGKVATTKRRYVTVFGVEANDCTEAYESRRCRFEQLVRLFVRDDVSLMDRFVVLPAGGDFPRLPKSFHLGRRYTAIHYSFASDRMVRIGGHAEGVGSEGLMRPLSENALDPTHEIMSDGRGHEWLRMEASATRPAAQYIPNDVFEIWEGFDVPGYVLVELTPTVKKNLLEPPESSPTYCGDTYKFIVEPLPGGPMDISVLNTHGKLKEEEPLVMWRMVVEFSKTVDPPHLVDRLFIVVPEPRPIPPPMPKQCIDDYGMFKTMAFNQVLAQQRIDRLRALGDPRVQLYDGPKLKPEMERRKVEIADRRETLLYTLQKLIHMLPEMHELGLFHEVTVEEVEELYEKLLPMHDDHHAHQFRKRNMALSLGCNFMAEMLCRNNAYETMGSNESSQKLLLVLAECLGLNSTYTKKSEDVKKMLLYFFKKKLHNYL